MKTVIVFHSVTGNGFLLARQFRDELERLGVTASLFRVADPLWKEKPDLPFAAQDNLRGMMALPEATPQVLVDAELIIMGSPTYFGNVSAPMKAFLDSTGGLWVKGSLAGKRFAAFTSAGNAEGGGDLCLQALHTYAKYMGMLAVPLPVTVVPGVNTPASGVIQYSAGKYAEVLDPGTARIISGFASFLRGCYGTAN